jgi:uncharacterized membrane protein YphA (DoxX/SURF4 family)
MLGPWRRESGRRTPLASSRRSYPGFFGALFLVLLRMAIGWHFLTEGLEKFESTRKGGKPFSAEGYLRRATGPFAPYFRGLVPDVNGLARLDPVRLKAGWAAETRRIAQHYGFDANQQSQADALLRDSETFAEAWFQDPETAEKRRKYLHELHEVQAIERDPRALAYQRERAAARRNDLDADRRALVELLDQRAAALRGAVIQLATAEQREAAGPYQPAWTVLDLVNLATVYGLMAIGGCLLIGLLTPLAALAAAVFLGQIYLSMPPWPGLPPNPMAEGHYWIVNKNLIEMLACLVVASTPNGHWVGLDALVFRRRERREAPADPRRLTPRDRAAATAPIPLSGS